jgi:F-type H+-transporting ATPase subunit b
MSELFSQLGIDWRLFLSQAANFIILLVVLRFFAYEPILKVLKERREKIADGFAKAAEADRRLGEMNELAAKRMHEVEQEALVLMREAEQKAKRKEGAMLDEAKRKEDAMLKQADAIIAAKAIEARQKMEADAADLVKDAIRKTVELDPKHIDDALVKKAVAGMKRS